MRTRAASSQPATLSKVGVEIVRQGRFSKVGFRSSRSGTQPKLRKVALAGSVRRYLSAERVSLPGAGNERGTWRAE